MLNKLLILLFIGIVFNKSLIAENYETSVLGKLNYMDVKNNIIYIGDIKIYIKNLKKTLKNKKIKLNDEVYVKGISDDNDFVIANVIKKVINDYDNKNFKIDESFCCDNKNEN